MKIGIDLRALQTGHKFRGIGEVAKQTTNRIVSLAVSEPNADISFIFYEYDDDDPKDLLDLPKNLTYEVVKLGAMPENNNLATKRDKINRHAKELYGSPIKDSRKSDVFLQFDYAFGVPKDTKTVLIKHDLIPYVFWDKYFESAWVPFKNKAMRTTLRTLFANYRFMRLLRRALKDAHAIIAVSHSTKKDLESFFSVKSDRVKVAQLGVDVEPTKTNETVDGVSMPTKPYLLFVGAGDARRRVDDLVAAYNNVKAAGYDIQLALVGENFKSPTSIPNVTTRNAVLHSSYADDIITLGYIDDRTKQELFKNALAFVYPTKYEGFGIPVLEAMLLECPVIAYRNSSLPEVGGEHVRFVKDWMGMQVAITDVIVEDKNTRNAGIESAKRHADNFTWDKTANIIYQELLNVSRD